MELDYCPDAGCHLPAEIVERFTLTSTGGPLEHVAVRCLDGHQFVMPVDGLPRAS
jgi:hypothetical protein